MHKSTRLYNLYPRVAHFQLPLSGGWITINLDKGWKMAFWRKKKDKDKGDKGKDETVKHTCECTCWHCEIGAHERCQSPDCKMPKWKDINRER
jgi:hypothetical protein